MILRRQLLISSYELDPLRIEREEEELNNLLNDGYSVIHKRETEKRPPNSEISVLFILWKKD